MKILKILKHERVPCTPRGSPDPLGPIQDGFISSCDSLDPTSISTSTVWRRQCIPIRFQAQPGRIRPIRRPARAPPTAPPAPQPARCAPIHTRSAYFRGPCCHKEKHLSLIRSSSATTPQSPSAKCNHPNDSSESDSRRARWPRASGPTSRQDALLNTSPSSVQPTVSPCTSTRDPNPTLRALVGAQRGVENAVGHHLGDLRE